MSARTEEGGCGGISYACMRWVDGGGGVGKRW